MGKNPAASDNYPGHVLFRHIPVPTYIWLVRDNHFILEDFNKAASDYSGPKLASLIGKTAEQVYHDRPDILKLMHECRETKAPVEQVIDLTLRTTGELRTLQSSWLWIEPEHLLFCAQDITETRKTELLLQDKVNQQTEELSTALAELEYREHFLNQVFDSIQEGICVLSPEMEILKINATMQQWYSDQPRFEGEKCYRIFQRDRDSICDFCPAHETILKKKPNHAVVKAFRPDSPEDFWFSVHTFPMLDGKGNLIGIIEFVRNITEQKNLELQLKDSEVKYRSIVENVPSLVYSYSPSKGAVYNSPLTREILGHRVQDLLNNPMLWHDSIHPEDLPQVDNTIKSLSPGDKGQLEYRIRDKEGNTHWFLDQFAMLETGEGELMVHGVATDFTEQKENEQRIKFLSTITENQADSVMVTDREFKIIYINPAAEELFGYSFQELEGKSPDIFNADEDRALQSRIYEQIARGETVLAEALNKRKDGSLFYCQFRVIPLRNETNEIINYIGVQRDITERVQAEKELAASENRYRTLSGLTFEGIVLHDHGIALDVNQTFLDMTGYSRDEIIGHSLYGLTIPEDQHTLIKEKVDKQQTELYESVIKTKSGQRIPVEIEARQIDYQGKNIRVTALRDITERKKAEAERQKLEEQLRQKYKMEAIGTMAGGIAHNFNNNLSIILGNVELSQLKLAPDSGIGGYLDNARKAIFNSRDLVSQILSYSRKSMKQRVPVDLMLMISETLNMLRATIPSTVLLEENYSDASRNLKVNADASQLQESLINLCNNAVHAMDEKGHLAVTLDSVSLTDKEIPATSNCRSGVYAKLSVQDDGCGMDNETLNKIFDPFFTTKGVNEGTGMGLPSVLGIIEQHGGFINVNSIPDKGSVFDLYLPILVTEASKPEQKSSDHKLKPGSGRILFVDDESMMTNLAMDMLTELGYRVIAETSSRTALKHILEDKNAFDLVITDQTMPELTGSELIRQLKTINPDIPTILCTGFSKKIDKKKAKEIGASAFCVKPIDFVKLSQTIDKLIHQKSK